MLRRCKIAPKKKQGSIARRLGLLNKWAKEEGHVSLAKMVGPKGKGMKGYLAGIVPTLATIEEISDATGARCEWIAWGMEPAFETEVIESHVLPKDRWALMPRLDEHGMVESGNSYCAEIDTLRTQLRDLTPESKLASFLVRENLEGSRFPMNCSIVVDRRINTLDQIFTGFYLIRDKFSGKAIPRKIQLHNRGIYKILFPGEVQNVERPFTRDQFNEEFEVLGIIRFVATEPNALGPNRSLPVVSESSAESGDSPRNRFGGVA